MQSLGKITTEVIVELRALRCINMVMYWVDGGCSSAGSTHFVSWGFLTSTTRFSTYGFQANQWEDQGQAKEEDVNCVATSLPGNNQKWHRVTLGIPGNSMAKQQRSWAIPRVTQITSRFSPKSGMATQVTSPFLKSSPTTSQNGNRQLPLQFGSRNNYLFLRPLTYSSSKPAHQATNFLQSFHLM